jgi:NAD+ synthase (glutamine-hydrolysing)
MRIAIAQFNPTVGALVSNTQKIIQLHQNALGQGADITLFPELALCGYPPDDLLMLPDFIDAIDHHLKELCQKASKGTLFVGLARRNNTLPGKPLFNSAVCIHEGAVLGYQDKHLLPEYDVFFEKRYFARAEEVNVFELYGKRIVVTICEDIWKHHVTEERYSVDPIEKCVALHPDIVLNLSSSPFSLGKFEQRKAVCQSVCAQTNASIFYCNQWGGNDDIIFDGGSFALDERGKLLSVASVFQDDLLVIDLEKRIYSDPPKELDESLLFCALVTGVRDYFFKQRFKKAVLGLSGGIDSALGACIAVQALGRENVKLIALPTRFSSEGSFRDAKALADNLGCDLEQVPIEEAFQCFERSLEEIFPGRSFSATDENLQARLRGVYLMAYSNETGALVLSCSNKSESAVGYTTLYGDQCGGLAILSDVTKKQVYALSRFINRDHEVIPKAIIEKPPSAELRLDQKDSDTLPPYDVIDRVIELYVERHLSPEKISKEEGLPLPLVKQIVGKIHASEFKRRQAPPGLRVTQKAFSAGRRFPIVQHWNRYETTDNS